MKVIQGSMSGGRVEDSHLDCPVPEFDDVFGLSSDTPVCPEMFDLDDVFPDLTVISTRQTSIPDQAELYCFEDFEGDGRLDDDNGGVREEDVAEYCSTLYSTLQALLHTGELQCIKGKELLRSKTLPVISLPISVNGELVHHPPSTRVIVPHTSSSPKNSTASSDKSSRRSSPSLSDSSSNDGRCKHRSTNQRRQTSIHRNSNQYRDKCPAWRFDDDTESVTSTDTVPPGGEESLNKHTAQLFYTTPPRANMVYHGEYEKRLETTGGISKLARRLSQKDRKERHKVSSPRQRSISLDCGDGRRVKILSTSPSSENSQTPSTENMTLAPSASAPAFKDINSLSPSPKLGKTFISPKRKGSTELESGGASPNKTDKRRNDKDKKSSYDINGLFDAVEHQDMDLVKVILGTNGLDVNSTNEEKLTPLDVAVLTNNIPMAKTLLSYGARENPTFQQNEARAELLESLVSDAEHRVVDLTAAVLSGSGNTGVSSVQQQKENERQLSHWEFRHRLLKRMKAGYDHARAPDAPASVLLGVASSSSLLVRFDEPLNHNGAVVTRYKVEWSCFENFTPLAGEALTDDVQHLEYEIPGLIKGNVYYVRVAAGNMKGYGPCSVANPPYAVPSSWRDIEGNKPRSDGKLKLLEDLFSQVKQSRPANAPEIKDTNGSANDSPVQRKRKSIKNLFASAPKFQKTLRRGVYLACLLYNEDRVLVTSEEQIPIVEVDENFTAPSIHADFHWMMKIACTWDDVKSLRQDMDRSSSGTVHFRSKLLQAAAVLQNALGIHDLGQFYHQPLKDDGGCILLTTVNYIRDPKHVALISGKWIPISKLQRRLSLSGSESNDAAEMLLNSLSEMILYHQVSMIPLPRGLYLGYLKLRCSMDLILRVLVHQKTPNVLPYTKIRECPNVSREEWEWVQRISDTDQNCDPTEAQLEFHKDLIKSCQRLLDVLGVSEENVAGHRMYDVEVIELSPEVSFLLIMPLSEEVCSVPGQPDDFNDKPEFTPLTVPVFEMIHMCSYQAEFISRYSRLSSILETDLYLAQQAQRGAFSNEELNLAKERVDLLDNLQQNLEKAWKAMRWIMDVISYARDKNVRGGIPLSILYALPSPAKTPQEKENENNNSGSVCNTMTCESNQIQVGKDKQRIAKFYDPNEELLSGPTHSHSDRFHTRDLNPLTAAQTTARTTQSGILRVYAAYETGLAKGTSVKLHVTPKTTAREVMNLVVQQLNKAVCMKGRNGPIYPEEQFNEFCLVAVIGARERVLRDDYQPLQLQNPWTKGRLYVRMKSNLLAAIQQGQATAV